MIVVDMDDTLLRDDKTISKETESYLLRLQSSGVKITIASGRPFRAIKPYYDEIGLKGKIVCGNGCMIIDPQDSNKILFQVRYPKDLVSSIVAGIGFDNFKNVYAETHDKVFMGYDNHVMDSYSYTNGMQIVYGNNFDVLPEDLTGVIFDLKDMSFRSKFLELGFKKKGIGARFWDHSSTAELFYADINKYTAAKKVAEMEKVPFSNVICFGDAENDIEMIHKAGIGVAMKNGNEMAKYFSAMVSLDDNNHDGVMQTLKLLFAGKY